MSNAYGRVNDGECFNDYGQKYINLLEQSIKDNSNEKVIEYCQKLHNHGSYENESMQKALPLAQEIGNETIINTVTENCGYYALNVTSGNMTIPVYPTFSGDLAAVNCDQL